MGVSYLLDVGQNGFLLKRVLVVCVNLARRPFLNVFYMIAELCYHNLGMQ